MKKLIIIIVTAAVLVIAYWLASPLFIDKFVSEDFPEIIGEGTSSSANTPASTTASVLAKGTFSGFDRVHQGSGTVALLKIGDDYVIRFEDDFMVSNGPDLYVGFGRNGEYVKGSDIARLKGNVGSQNYAVPAEVNIEDYNEVWIWCRAFSVPFAKAKYVISDMI